MYNASSIYSIDEWDYHDVRFTWDPDTNNSITVQPHGPCCNHENGWIWIIGCYKADIFTTLNYYSNDLSMSHCAGLPGGRSFQVGGGGGKPRMTQVGGGGGKPRMTQVGGGGGKPRLTFGGTVSGGGGGEVAKEDLPQQIQDIIDNLPDDGSGKDRKEVAEKRSAALSAGDRTSGPVTQGKPDQTQTGPKPNTAGAPELGQLGSVRVRNDASSKRTRNGNVDLKRDQIIQEIKSNKGSY